MQFICLKTDNYNFSYIEDVFKNLLGNYPGRIVSIIIYLIGVSLGGFVIYLISYYLKELASKKEGKLWRKKQLS